MALRMQNVKHAEIKARLFRTVQLCQKHARRTAKTAV